MGDGFQSLQRKDGAVTVVGGQREGGEEVGAENPLLDIRYNELKQIGASLNDDFLLDGAIAGDGGSIGGRQRGAFWSGCLLRIRGGNQGDKGASVNKPLPVSIILNVN